MDRRRTPLSDNAVIEQVGAAWVMPWVMQGLFQNKGGKTEHRESWGGGGELNRARQCAI